ncbi:hypothetical protein HW423_05890 [Aerococcaceae bacterium INB8]|uniref:RadC-like JAB domain-containing protein n=1 Tax=Ruoffia halotolerans TaxID=2748684 RepID=A0A839A5X5_9LACT|nr:JAB domain-containing protein [Ruoffia halotolerans]MBA5729311.1 hypothetical protein [Ruoffia halotolerans]
MSVSYEKVVEIVRLKQVVCDSTLEIQKITSSFGIAQWLMDEIGNETQEVLMLLCLNTKNEVNSLSVVHRGTINIFIQLERSVEKVNLLFNNLRYNGKVQGKLVFVNPEGLIRLDEHASEVGMNRAEFIHWIKGIARDEQHLPLANISPIALKERILNEFQIEKPNPPIPKSMKDFNQMKRGVKCARCHSFDITQTMYKVICNQYGHHEAKKKSVVRTLCEYGLIRYKEPLTVSEYEVFLDGQVSKKYIARTLSKYFENV